MKVIKVFLIIIFGQLSISTYSQDLDKHKWNNRLLLISTLDHKNTTYQKQLLELKKENKALKERKLLVYHLRPNQFKKGLYTKNWKNMPKDFENYLSKNKAFEIILIGLDGGIKLRQSHFLSHESLFATIDVMPMRRQELNVN